MYILNRIFNRFLKLIGLNSHYANALCLFDLEVKYICNLFLSLFETVAHKFVLVF